MPLDNTNDLIEDLNNLGDSNDIKTLWEDITGNIQGTIEMFYKQSPFETEFIPINLDKWMLGEDALVVPIQDSRPVDEGAVKDANGKVVLADIDANGDYILLIGYDVFDDPIPPTTPLVGNYALIWQIKGEARDTFIIPTEKEVVDFDSDPALIQDGVEIIPAKNGSYIYADNLGDLSKIGSHIVWGCEISKNVSDPSKFDIAEGLYKIINNYSVEQKPSFTLVYYAGSVGNTISLIAVTNATFLGLNKDQTIIQQPFPIRTAEERDICPIGGLTHTDKINIDKWAIFGNYSGDNAFLAIDMMTCFGNRINCGGNRILANGTDLKIKKLLGTMTGAGINSSDSIKSRNTRILAEISPLTFQIAEWTAGISIFTESQNVPTTQYQPQDEDGIPQALEDIPDGFFVTLRFIIAPAFESATQKGEYILQHSQFAYDTLKKAVDSFQSEDYKYGAEIEGAHTKCILIVQKGTTDLSDFTKVKFCNLGVLGARAFIVIPNSSKFSNSINTIRCLSNERQTITYYDSGGVLYADIAKIFEFKRDDISFANADSSINTAGGDFDNDSMYVGSKIIISESVNNNGIFTVVSITSLKIVVSETIIDESAGADIVIETSGLGDMTYNYGELEFKLDCTNGDGIGGRARIAITEGTDTSPQENWAYVIKESDNTLSLNQSTAEQRNYEFTNVFSALVPSIASSIADGFYNSRRWTEAKSVNGKGLFSTLLSERRDSSDWKSGLLLNITIDTGPTPDDVDFTMETGVITEIYDQNISPLQLSVDGALVVNEFGNPYNKIANLNEISLDSKGVSLNNKYFSVAFIISLNADGYPDRFLIKLPSGSYTNPESAFDDTKGYLDASLPKEFKSAYYLGVGVFRIVGGNSWTNIAISEGGVNYIDKRGDDLKSSASGSGTTATQKFSDGNFGLFNALDSTKTGVFDLSNITTGNERKITWADRDLDLANPLFDTLRIGANNTIDIASNQLRFTNTLAGGGFTFNCERDGSSPEGAFVITKGLSGVSYNLDAYNLIIDSGSGVAVINLLTSNTGLQGLVFGDTDDDNIASLLYSHSADRLSYNYAGNNYLNIESDGNVLKPFQANFGAYKNANSTNVTGDGTQVKVTFGIEWSDIGGNYNTADGRYTAPVSGYHNFTGAVRMIITGITSSHTAGLTYLNTSNKLLYGNYDDPYASGRRVYVSTWNSIDMDVGDTAQIDLVVFGGTKVIGINGSASLYFTYFTGGLKD